MPASYVVGMVFLFAFLLLFVTLPTKPTNLSIVAKSTEIRQCVTKSDPRVSTLRNRPKIPGKTICCAAISSSSTGQPGLHTLAKISSLAQGVRSLAIRLVLLLGGIHAALTAVDFCTVASQIGLHLMAGGLTGGSWLLLVAHSAWSLVISVHMYKFWERRKTTKIFSRWPTLALLSGCAGIVVQTSIVVQEVMAQEGKVLPCVIILYHNTVLIVLWTLPYLLRGLRAVILSRTRYRRRFIKYFSRGRTRVFMVTSFIAVLGACAVLQQVSPQIYGRHPTEVCIYLEDWWFWGPLCFAIVLLASKLFRELVRLNDRTNLASEILFVTSVWLACAIPYFPMSALNAYGVLEVPRQFGFIVWLATFLTLTSTFVVEPRRRRGESLCRKQEKVGIVVDDLRSAAWRARWHNSEVIMSHPILDKAYEKHVRDFLCWESYQFIKEVESYNIQAGENPAGEVFVHFRRIADTFVSAGSELEINISNSMRNEVLKIVGKAQFIEATLERRRDVFTPSKMEVMRMLDENLICTFVASPQFLASCKEWQEEHDLEAAMSGESSLPSEPSKEGRKDEGFLIVQDISDMEKSTAEQAKYLGPSTVVTSKKVSPESQQTDDAARRHYRASIFWTHD